MASRLRYRDPLADDGSPYVYAEWLRELRNENGCYVIRDADTRETLYVGESHSSRLYTTITRHFQAWEGYTAGTRYDPADVEVAVRTMPPSAAPGHQLELIERLDPADNSYGRADLEELDPAEFSDKPDVPF